MPLYFLYHDRGVIEDVAVDGLVEDKEAECDD